MLRGRRNSNKEAVHHLNDLENKETAYWGPSEIRDADLTEAADFKICCQAGMIIPARKRILYPLAANNMVQVLIQEDSPRMQFYPHLPRLTVLDSYYGVNYEGDDRARRLRMLHILGDLVGELKVSRRRGDWRGWLDDVLE